TAQTVFGGRGATDFITRATMVLGGAFFVTSLVLALLSSSGGRSRSLIQEQARQVAPVAPAPASQRPGAPGATTPAPGGAAGSKGLLPAPANGSAPASGSAPAGGAPATKAPASAAPPKGGPPPSNPTKPPGGGP